MAKKTKNEDGSERDTTKRLQDSKQVYVQTGEHRAAMREYCRGNRWLEENARAVGNW